MPFTRLACTAIDNVASMREDVVESICAYGGSDLLCYRAAEPEELVDLQNNAWNPVLEWLVNTLGAPMTKTTGLIPVQQPPATLARLRQEIEKSDNFQMAALLELVTLTGSLALGLCVVNGFGHPEEVWRKSQIDEDWQKRNWGVDEEAEAATARKFADFLAACEFARKA